MNDIWPLNRNCVLCCTLHSRGWHGNGESGNH